MPGGETQGEMGVTHWYPGGSTAESQWGRVALAVGWGVCHALSQIPWTWGSLGGHLQPGR